MVGTVRVPYQFRYKNGSKSRINSDNCSYLARQLIIALKYNISLLLVSGKSTTKSRRAFSTSTMRRTESRSGPSTPPAGPTNPPAARAPGPPEDAAETSAKGLCHEMKVKKMKSALSKWARTWENEIKKSPFLEKNVNAKFLPVFMKTRTNSENLYGKKKTLCKEFLRHTKSADDWKNCLKAFCGLKNCSKSRQGHVHCRKFTMIGKERYFGHIFRISECFQTFDWSIELVSVQNFLLNLVFF